MQSWHLWKKKKKLTETHLNLEPHTISTMATGQWTHVWVGGPVGLASARVTIDFSGYYTFINYISSSDLKTF